MDASDVPVFAGTSRFAVQRQIGAGGMGVVYEVFDRERDARVALKVLPYADPSALIRFKREFRSLTSILHPNLVELYELFADGEQWFFTMEAIDGVDLLTWVRPAALDHARLRQSLRQLVRGVKAVHDAGRLHHDLKPSNVMVRPDGTVIILDFGLVTELGDRPDPHVITGTAAYMAPERWSDDPPTTASDWYSIGVMLHELLTGVTPFGPKLMDMLRAKLSMDAPRPSLSHDGIPDDLDALCADLLRRDPTARADGDEILRRLGDAVIVDEPEPGEQHLLVGRERHLHLMNEAYRRMEAGATVTAHLQGPSGTGKSTLLTRFLSAVRELPDTVVLSGRCFEQESVPYKALDSLIDALAEYLGALDDADVEPLIPVQAAVLARVFPVLQRVTAFARAPGGVSRMSDPRELRRAAVSALREMLTRIGQRRNLVLVIDDLQWGDVDSALVIGDLLQPPDPPRALVVLAYRSEYAARSACLSTLLQHEVVAEPWQTRVDIAVEPLSTAESEELARRLLSSTAGVSAADVARIAHDAGGNPYFIAELVRHVATGMRRDLPGTSDDIDLDGMLWSRVQRLPATARELLSIIAVAGQPLALGELLDTATASPDLPRALARLRGENLLRSTGTLLSDQVEAYHDRVRECVRNRLSSEMLRRYHAGLAATLDATGTADAETVAEHFEGAGDLLRAGRYYAMAAERASVALAFEKAAVLYRRALRTGAGESATQSEWQRELGHALSNAGRGFEAAEAYLAAVKMAPPEAHFDLERLAAEQYCISGYVRDGQEIFRRLLKRVGLDMPSQPALVLGKLLLRRTRLSVRGLSFKQRTAAEVDPDVVRRIDLLWSVAAGLSIPDAIGVASLQTKGLLLALDAGEPYRLARALAFEAFLAGTSGTHVGKRADALLDKADALAQQIDNPHAIGVANVMRSMVSHLHFRFREAIRHADFAEEVLRSRCSGVWWELSVARTVTTWGCFYLADCAELRRRHALYMTDARERGDRLFITSLRTVATPFLHLLDDEPDAADETLRDALSSWQGTSFDFQHTSALFS
ncbi:MAG: protein kinase, partial [Gemmatimonadaceae bacterium]|nr:protein kinase [Gemmatimonadaceae bacterium]